MYDYINDYHMAEFKPTWWRKMNILNTLWSALAGLGSVQSFLSFDILKKRANITPNEYIQVLGRAMNNLSIFVRSLRI